MMIDPAAEASYAPRPQPPTAAVQHLQRALEDEARARPVCRDEPEHVTRARWEHILAAYAHQLERAKAHPAPLRPLQPRLPLIPDDPPTTHVDTAPPAAPIVHAAGAIPAHVEQRVTDRIERRDAALARLDTPQPGLLTRVITRWLTG
jgi:hypothetical protein